MSKLFSDAVEERMHFLEQTNRIQQIIASYEAHDEDDVSTERLLAMVADDCGWDVSDVVEVLALKGEHG